MKLDERRYLERLQNDFSRIAPLLQALATRMVAEGVSQYPVFVAARQSVDLGLPLAEASSLGLFWNFRASHLEQLVAKGLVPEDQVAAFRQRHSRPEEEACLLLIPPGGQLPRLVFIPFATPQQN